MHLRSLIWRPVKSLGLVDQTHQFRNREEVNKMRQRVQPQFTINLKKDCKSCWDGVDEEVELEAGSGTNQGLFKLMND